MCASLTFRTLSAQVDGASWYAGFMNGQLEVIKNGAPPKVTTETLERAKQFVGGEWQKYNATVPTVEGLAMHLGLYRTYIYECQDLSDTLEQVQRLQASILIERGLTNEYNASIVKLLLSAKHGYIEKSEVSQNHSMTSQPSETIASDFNAYVKSKTEALPQIIEGDLTQDA